MRSHKSKIFESGVLISTELSNPLASCFTKCKVPQIWDLKNVVLQDMNFTKIIHWLFMVMFQNM